MLAAAAAGAAIGVLMAPEKGSDLRQRIKAKVDDLMDDIAELLALGQEEIKEMYSGAKESMQDGMQTVKNNVSEAYSQM